MQHMQDHPIALEALKYEDSVLKILLLIGLFLILLEIFEEKDEEK